MDDYADTMASAWPSWSRSREVTPAELIEAAIARIERHNPKINAVVYEAFDEARAGADALPRRAVPRRAVPGQGPDDRRRRLAAHQRQPVLPRRRRCGGLAG